MATEDSGSYVALRCEVCAGLPRGPLERAASSPCLSTGLQQGVGESHEPGCLACCST